MNSTLDTHKIYTSVRTIPEFKRKVFTRIRLASHYLKSETGRWNVPPTPIDRRFCVCGYETQTEAHIIENCPLSNSIRLANSYINFSTQYLLNTCEPNRACNLIFDIYNIYC